MTGHQDGSSPTPDPHEEWSERLAASVAGLLDPAETELLGRHREGCERCRAELAELLRLTEGLRRVDPERLSGAPEAPGELSPALEAAIAARIAEPSEPGSQDTPAAPVVALPTHRRRLLAVAAVAAVLALVAGVGGYQLGRPAPGPFEPVAVSAPVAGPVASAGVIPHTWGMEIRLDARGFRAGERYVVSVIDEAGTRRDAGEFIGTGDNPMICNLNSSVLRQDATGFEVVDDQDRVVLSSRF